MAFIEERLLECVTYGTSGGPTWRTRKITLQNGVVRRNPLRALPLYRYHVQYRNLRPTDHREVYHAFNACMGGVHSFRLKDWHDFQAAAEVVVDLGTGAAQQVQLTKAYTFGAQTIFRRIRKPLAGVVLEHAPTLDGSWSVIAGAAVDTATGIATLTTTAGHFIRWTGEFDVPVMFEEDELPFTGEDKGAEGLFLTGDVPLIEDTSV